MIVIIQLTDEFELPLAFSIETPWEHHAAGTLQRRDGAVEAAVSGDGLAKPVELTITGRAAFASVGDLLVWLEQLKAAAADAVAIEHRANGYTRRWDVWSGRYGLQTKTGPDNGKAANVTLTFYPKGEGVVV